MEDLGGGLRPPHSIFTIPGISSLQRPRPVLLLIAEVRQPSPLALLEPIIDRQRSRPTRHYSKRHGRPGYVHRPAVRYSKLDHKSHHQEPARSQSGRLVPRRDYAFTALCSSIALARPLSFVSCLEQMRELYVFDALSASCVSMN